ncbi:DUF3291 domain-containing protein [Deinococcus sonorensis]|uniref:DUF3291 domain-containing protein n=2 Tax=Deinococcus sonorensis TaxID=309891 RepID=A0AAU7U6K0_9DEIO
MQLAQVNIARFHHPLAAPEVDEFRAGLDPVNALADRAPGFVWRLQDDTGNAPALGSLDDPRLIVNLSVGESPAALRDFTDSGRHLAFLKRRRAWFMRPRHPSRGARVSLSFDG